MALNVSEERNPCNWYEELANFDSNVFQCAPWLDAFTTQSRKPIFLRFTSGAKTVGLAAGLKNHSRHLLLRRITKELFLFTGPTVDRSNQDLANNCLKSLRAFAHKNCFIQIYLGSYDYPYALNVEQCGFKKNCRKEYIIDLRGSINDIRKNLMKGRKAQISKGIREGLGFFITNSLSAVKPLVSCLETTKGRREERGIGDYSYYYMPFLNEGSIGQLVISNVGRIFEARKGKNVVSSNFTLVSSNRAYDLLAGTTPMGYELGASSFLLWKIIETLKSEGVEYYNLGGIPNDSSGAGLALFKRSFGAREQVCSGGLASYMQGPLINFLSKMYLNIRRLANR